MPIPENSVKGF